MTAGAITPEELETLLEDALMVRDRPALEGLFEPGAVVAAGGLPPTRLVVTLLLHDVPYLAHPRRVLQARETALIVAEHGISVARRGSDARWRYAIALLDPQPEGGTHP